MFSEMSSSGSGSGGGGGGGSTQMGSRSPFFHEFKKQASFFFKEKIKTARLALTDVTPAELLTEEATDGNPWSPDTRTMGLISRAAFEVDDFERIVDVLHNRLLRFDRKNWRSSYNSVILLEHLLTHGPESVAHEFQREKGVIEEIGSFQYIDEKGFNWGLTVRKKSEWVLKLLQKGPLLKEERDRARKVTRGIQGFGGFNHRSTPAAQGILRESSFPFRGMCYSHSSDDENQFNRDEGIGKSQETKEDNVTLPVVEGAEEGENQTSFKENMAPVGRKPLEWSRARESKPLLGGNRDDELRAAVHVEEDHPFDHTYHQTSESLLTTRNAILQGC